MIQSNTYSERQIAEPTSNFSPASVLEPPSRGGRLPAGLPETHSAQEPRGGWMPMELGRYQVRLAQSLAEREAACRLRFKVFNIELGEGLQDSYKTGMDTDHFDLFCEQLIVEDRHSRAVVGTYRMQTGTTAARNLGYYCEQEFDFVPYEPLRPSILELGRASIDREHRSSEVLTLLWRGIAQYARVHDLRYLVGCSSLNSQDPKAGWQIYRQLAEFLAAGEFRTAPTARFTLPFADEAPETPAKVPKLLRTYIGIGAKICGPPAWDREFGTIDFLTLLDMRELTPAARVRFLIEAQ
jgi:putative hemolysin